MRFAPIAVFAGVAAAKVYYETDYVTVTSCGPEVTNCPARSTATYSSVRPASTTGAVIPTAPASVSTPCEESTTPYEAQGTTPAAGVPPPAQTPMYPIGGTTEVMTYSTCVPVYSYHTVTIYPTTTAHPTGTGAHPPVYPTVPPTAGAPKMVGSVVLAAAAGVAAVMLA